MNSSLLLALNTAALAVLVMFHFQSTGTNDSAQISQPVPHHLQQRPQLAVMAPNAHSSVNLAQDNQAVLTSEHWVF